MEEEKVIGQYKVTGKDKTDSILTAVDTVKGRKVFITQYEDDINIYLLRYLSHKNLTDPLDVVKMLDSTYLVYEYSESKSLAEYVRQKGKLAEREIKVVLWQILKGYEQLLQRSKSYPKIAKLTKMKMFYQNITPENIFVKDENRLTIKLGGIGNAGEPSSAASGVIEEKRSDIWSIGAIIFFMVSARPLTPEEVKEPATIIRGDDMSKNCFDLMLLCLQEIPSKIVTLKEIKAHPFMPPRTKKFNEGSFDTQLIDKAYICYCDVEDQVILSCGHSFCMDCISVLQKRALANYDDFTRVIDNTKDLRKINSNCSNVMVKCAKCLDFF
eukprot:TRINITY_DN3590_c0_g2_i1.p1 TRINITY_DN3590_c0_g2~~TRINITY_DN3590_c0_g2_i1.p1  ORF type:complete len:327 (+),score=42.58 TRINITY_DN3590_c0_g2_i1:62-1042(+)